MSGTDSGLATIGPTAEDYDEVVLDLDAVTGDAPARGRDEYVDVAADVDAEPLPPAEAWATFDPLLWAYALASIRQETADALGELEDAVRDGRRPTPEEIDRARGALQEAESLVEEYYVPLAADSGGG